MEIWDIIDEHGNKKGRTVQRGSLIKDGDYMLAVHIYIYNSKGEYLIQKRSMKKSILPGAWDITGGAVISGEDSKTAALREVKEEIGIDLDENEMRVAARLKRRHSLVDIWFAKADFDIDSSILQEDEVDAVRFVSAEKLISIVFDGEHRDDDYKGLIKEYISRQQK